MDITISPGKLKGTVTAIPSKSQAHRLLICAAFSAEPTTLFCPQTNQDIEATVSCLNSLGAEIIRTEAGYHVIPITQVPEAAVIDCSESGSTLRFMLPILCALGVNSTIKMAGRLPYRPLSPLWEELEKRGCTLTRPTESTLNVYGKLHCGDFEIAGNVSSQFITGLLFAAALINGESRIHVTGLLESKPYVDMTQQVLSMFGVSTQNFVVKGRYPFTSPGKVTVEGDWSNAAFFLAASQLGNDLQVDNLNHSSAQGDRRIAEILACIDAEPVIDASDIPDLVPILAVYFAAKSGAKFTGVRRLRLKESDRIASVCNLLHTLGIAASADENTLTVKRGTFNGGIVDAVGDHRIAMAAGIAATIATGPVTILDAHCVSKSYPAFWQEFKRLGGNYEQYIR